MPMNGNAAPNQFPFRSGHIDERSARFALTQHS